MVCGSGGSHNGSRWNGLVGEVEGERSERAWKGVVRGRRQGCGTGGRWKWRIRVGGGLIHKVPEPPTAVAVAPRYLQCGNCDQVDQSSNKVSATILTVATAIRSYQVLNSPEEGVFVSAKKCSSQFDMRKQTQ